MFNKILDQSSDDATDDIQLKVLCMHGNARKTQKVFMFQTKAKLS